MSLLVVGSVAIDSIETPNGKADNVIGGAATYSAVAASFFVPVRMVAAIGDDFPRETLDDLAGRGIDLAGVEHRKGRTLNWRGRYHEDMNVRDTLHIDLGVFADFQPRLPAGYGDSPHVFLANIDPCLQESVLDQMKAPALVGCDTMNFWIEGKRPDLVRLLKRVGILVINDEETRMLSGERNTIRAARRVLDMGPSTLLVKRGEYGVIQFSSDAIFAVPAFPLEEVFDPTGAGDCFAGGFMGELARSGDTSRAGLRRAIVYGSVLASFVVEDFSYRRLARLSRDEIEQRYRQFVSLTDIDGGE